MFLAARFRVPNLRGFGAGDACALASNIRGVRGPKTGN